MLTLFHPLFRAACSILALILITAAFATATHPVLAQSCTLNASDVNGLISAITSANGNADADTICLTTGTYTFTAIHNTETDGANALPVITTNITIEGNGASLQRDTSSSAFRFFKVAAGGTLTLNDMTFSNGIQNSGGALLNLGTLNIDNGTFSANRATPSSAAAGGGVIFSTGTLNIANSTFSSTTMVGFGASLYVAGTNSITDSVFTQNQTSDGSGVVYLASGSMNITRVTFTENRTTGSSGYYQNSGTSTITDSVFDNNNGRLGTALYIRGGTMNVTGTIIRNNHADAGFASNGPALNSQNAYVTMSNSCIINNVPSSGNVSVQVGYPGNLTADNNWWGSSQGPLGGLNSYGGADSYNGNVTLTNFLTAPILGCEWMSPYVQNLFPGTTYRTPVNLTLLPRGGSPGYTYSILTNPTHGSLTGTAPDLTYTPEQFYLGSDSFTYQVTDMLGTTSNIATVSLNVSSSLQATNQSFNARYAADIPVTLSATGGWLPHTYSNITVSQGTITGTAPNLVYHPPLNYLGSAQIGFRVSDESGTSRNGTVTVTTTWDLSVPTQALLVAFETSKSITLSATGGTAPYTFSNISALSPSFGTLTGTAPNLTYTPPAGSSGNTSFTYRVTDAQGFTATGTVNLYVQPQLAAADYYTYVTPGTPATAYLGVIGGLYPYTYTYTQPTHGTLAGTPPNLTYTMDVGYSGVDSIDYTVTDTEGVTVSATRYFSSAEMLRAIDGVYNIPYEVPLSLTLGGTGGFSPYTFEIVTPPTHGTVSGTGINRIYTPNAGYSGGDSFIFLVTDVYGYKDVGTINITVGLPVRIDDQTLNGSYNTAVAITASASGGVTPYTYSISDPSGGTVTGTIPNLTYTPDNNFSGVDTFVITATDALGRSDTATISIRINTPFNVTDVNGLIAAINAANSDAATDIINVAAGTYNFNAVNNTTANGANALPVITTIITINGSGATLTRDAGAPNFRFFEVSSAGRLTLNELTISGGNVTGDGGGVVDRGGLTLTNVTFLNNTSSSSGGAVASYAPLTITGSSFSNNVSSRGGALYANSTATISGSTFVGNHTSSSNPPYNDGGAIYGALLLISDSTFTGNVATNNGGAIVIANRTNSYSTLTNLTLSNNAATYGGAIKADLGIVIITNSRLTNNAATYGSALYAIRMDGALSGQTTNVDISQSCIVGNNNLSVDYMTGSNAASVSALHNWWGAADGARVNNTGSGDAVKTTLNVSAPLTTPPTGCPVLPPAVDTQTVFAVNNAGRAFTLTPRGGLPPYSYSNISTPTHGTLSGTAPNLTYTANAGYIGDDSFTYTATDSVGGTASGTVMIHVLAPLTAENFPYTVTYPNTLTITFTSNTGLPPYTFSDITQPEHGEVIGNGSTVLYVPSETYGGVDTFTYRVTDATGASVVNTITVSAGTPPSATIVVNSNTQEVPMVTNGNCTLGEAMKAAELNTVVDACPAGTTGMDIIDIPAGTYVVSAVLVTTNQADHESFGFPQMYNPVTLRGASPDTTVIERVGSVSVSFFSVAPGGSVRIENMTLRNGGGNNIEHGGAVVSFGNLTINNVRFEHNDVYERGGAIYSANYATGSPEANLSIANSTFTDNHANIWGGAIYHGRAASLTVVNTLFYNNNVDSSGTDRGNDIWSFSNVALNYNCMLGGINKIYFGNSSQYNYTINSDWNWWGTASIGSNPLSERPAICNRVSIPTLNIPSGDTTALFEAIGYANTLPSAVIELAAGSTYNFNTVYDGGALGTMVLPTISGDITINGNGATITRNTDMSFYGRFFYVTGNLTLNNVIVANGRAPMGGAAYIYNGGSLTTVDTVFRNNSALASPTSSQGGAVAVDGTFALFIANNSRFEDNVADEGGAVMLRSGSITVTNSLFTHNVANMSGSSLAFEYRPTSAEIHDNCFTQNSGVSIYNDTIPPIDVTNNWWGAANGPSGQGTGNGDAISPQLIYSPFLTIRPSGCPVSELIAADQNLSVELSTPTVSVTLSAMGGVSPYSFSTSSPANGTLSGTAPNLTYTPNEGFNGVDTFTFTVTDSEGVTDTATITIVVDTSIILVDSTAQEVPFVTNGNCTLGEAIQAANSDTAVDACVAGSAADVIQLGTGLTYTLSLADNTVNSVGNGLPQITSDVSILGAGSTINRDNGAPVFRIMYVLVGGTLQLVDMTISGGYLTGTNTSVDGGAGIHSQGTLTLRNVTLTGNNNSNSTGGALWSNTTVDIQNSVFMNNYARVGAGGYVCNGTINNTNFVNNTGETVAALYHACGTLTVQNSHFTGNSANQGANTLYNNGYTDNSIGGIVRIIITNSIFENNTGGDSIIRNNENDTDGFQIGNSCIVQPGTGFVNQYGTNAVKAQNNWWGSISGPGGLASGYGTPIQQNLLTYEPFLTEPISGCDLFAPSISPLPTIRAISGAAYPIPSMQTVNGIAPFTYGIGTEPVHGTLTGNVPDTLVYTPDNAYIGSDSFTIIVTDSRGRSTTNTIGITVVPQVVVNDLNLQTPPNTALAIVFTASGGTPNFTFTHTNPTHGVITNSNTLMYEGDRITYTPFNGFNGVDSFTYTVTDTYGVTATATVTVTVGNPSVNLVLTQADNVDPIIVGQNLTYTLTVNNNSSNTANNVIITNTLPTGVTFVSAIASQGSACVNDIGVITCNLGTLSANSQATMTLVVTPTTQNAALTNTANVTASESDTNAADNTASTTTQVISNSLTLLSPLGEVNVGYGDPVYRWVDVGGAQYYYVYVNNAAGASIINEVVADAGYCDGVMCTLDATTLREQYRLVNGTYTVYLNTWNGTTQGTLRGPFRFTLTTAPPALVTVETPTNLTALRPTFGWSLSAGAANASYFNVYVAPANNPAAAVINQWLTRSAACGSANGMSCTLLSPVDLLDGASYNVYIRSYGPGGLSSGGVTVAGVAGFAGPQSFVVNAPSPNVPAAITVNNQQGRATVTWNDDANASYFYLSISNSANTSFFNQWLTRTSVCTPTCAITPTINLANGQYRVVMAAYGAGGMSSYSAPVPFTFTFAVPNIAEVMTFAPQGTVNTGSPTFTWNTVAGVTFYYLGVGTPSALSFQQWYDAAAICTPHPGTCSVSNSVNLAQGSYHWRLQGYGPGGLSALHNAPNGNLFTVSSSLPTTLSLNAPTGTIASSTPAFSWSDDPNVDWYNLLVSSGSTSVSNQWYRATRGVGQLCDAGTCSVTLPSALANGVYQWNARGYGAAGSGSYNASAITFTVNIPIPVVPLLVTPDEGALIHSTNRPTLVWNTVSYAVWYHLEVKNGMGTVVFSQWYQAGVAGCSVSSCTAQLPNPLAYGGYSWAVRAWSQGGLSAFSTARSFFSLSMNPQPLLVSAEDGRVLRSGGWTMTGGVSAVGQTYLSSSGSAGDSLTLTFSGTAAEVVYLAGAGYGSFVIEVDGVPVQQVNASATQESAGNLAAVSGLRAGEHTLRIIALNGAAIAIDAVIVDGQLIALGMGQPTPSPTIHIPTSAATAEATAPPSATATDEATLAPTVTPSPQPSPAPQDTPTTEVVTPDVTPQATATP